MTLQKYHRADFERWIQSHREALYRRAYQLTRNAADAEDLVQETFLRACARWEQLMREETTVAWLIAVQRNVFINDYRKKRLRPNFCEWTEDALPRGGTLCAVRAESAQSAAERQMESRVLVQAIRALPAKYREAILLADFDQLSYEEIAQRTGKPIGTVRSRIARGRKRLQRSLYAWRETNVYSF